MFPLAITRCSARSLKCNPPSPFRSFTSTTLRAKSALPKSPPRTSLNKPVERTISERTNIIATRILEAGRDELYKNTTSTGYLLNAYTVMALSYGALAYIYTTQLWRPEATKAQGLHWAVPIAYQVTMAAWGLFGGYAFMRTVGLVKSMKLIRIAGKVQLETTVRHPIPFVRPSKLVTDPYQLTINRTKLYAGTNQEGMIVASDGQSVVSRVTRSLFYSPFHNTRKLFGGVGSVPITVGEEGSRRHLSIDTEGQFSNGGQDLLDISRDEI